MNIGRAAEILGRGTCLVEVGGSVAPWTSYRLGGPADLRVEARAPADLALVSEAVAETGLTVLVIGRGSNMLVADAGFRGIVLRLGDGFRWIDIVRGVDDATIRAGAGLPLPTLAQRALEESLDGLAFSTAIPASVGGAIRMNAGAHGHELGEVVVEIDLWRIEQARSEAVSGRDAGFRYRTTTLPADAVIVGATLRLRPGDPAAIRAAMEEAKAWRRATQPINLPNGGSVFVNPPDDHAASLIERVVGKGTRVGGARISEVHANFIVADPGATSSDVHELIGQIRRRVQGETGITLQPEIKLIGFDQEPGGSG